MVCATVACGSVITAFTPYSPLGASSRVRVHEWAELVPEIHRVVASRAGGGRWFAPSTAWSVGKSRLRVSRAGPLAKEVAEGTVLVHREISPLSRGSLEGRVLRSAQFGVYDLDDALFADHGSGLRRVFPKSGLVARATQSADRVIAANAYLANWAEAECRDVVLIPSCVRTDRYTESTARPTNRPRIVWLGSPATTQYLEQLAKPLREVAARTGAVVEAIGADPRAAKMGSFVEVRPWRPGIEYTMAGDIGIMPLEDSDYARGKSAYKLLQYSASGMASVASPVGAATSIAESIGAWTATTGSEWTDILLQLLREDRVRETGGTAARAAVERGYSYDAWLPKFRKALSLS